MSSSEMSDVEETPDLGVVTPGEFITDSTVWMRGHGTYGSEGATRSSVAGTIDRVNKLLSVKPLRGRYLPVIGDHVVGRVTEVANRRWKVDIGATQDAVLQLGAVNLPGGILRRKSEDDELQMREFLKEGDLLNAEVQSLYHDGGAALHTRSTRYGKLRDGVFVSVPSSLVLRVRTQVYALEGGVEMIVGVNGYVWVRAATSTASGAPASANPSAAGPTSTWTREEQTQETIYSDKNREIGAATRANIARYCNVLAALVFHEIGINEERVKRAYEESLRWVDAGDLLSEEARAKLARAARVRE